jgi:hypothetical protein
MATMKNVIAQLNIKPPVAWLQLVASCKMRSYAKRRS